MKDGDDVVMDAEMLATLFAGLTESPDLFHALQFVTLAEASVLRESLVVVSVEDRHGGIEEGDANPAQALIHEFMEPLITAGVMRMEDIFIADEDELPDYLSGTPSTAATVVDAEDDPVANAIVMAGRSLTAERIRRKPAVTLPMQQAFYEMSANVRADHTVCDLTGRYQSVARVLDELRQGARMHESAYEIVPLPPIGLEVFQAAANVEELPDAVMRIRGEYEDLRRRLRDLQELLDDPSVNLDKKLKLRARWADAWKRLEKKYEFTGAVSLANTNSAIYKYAPDLPGAMALNPTSWIGLLKTTLQEAPELWSRWRMRALHRTLKRYVQSPDRALGESVEKVIGRAIDDDEVSDVRDVQALMVQLGESAVVEYRS